jgi:tetratricopeptide (TPR) repeat protein
MAWFNKGWTPDNVARARGLFDRALAAGPDNVDALVGSARADAAAGVFSYAPDPMAAFAAAEAKVTKALSSVPDHARGHMLLGFIEILTKRAAEGIPECEHALALDRNLAESHAAIGLGKIHIGRAAETEAHVVEALRLSPRDTLAYTWMNVAGLAKLHIGGNEQAVAWFRRAIEANRNFPIPYLNLAAALALLGRLDEARSALKGALALTPTATTSRVRAALTTRSDDPTFLAGAERIVEGVRKAGLPEE